MSPGATPVAAEFFKGNRSALRDEETPTADETNDPSAEPSQVRDHLKLLFGLTCVALIVGIVGLLAVTGVGGVQRRPDAALFHTGDSGQWQGWPVSLFVRKYRTQSGGESVAIRFTAAMTTVMAMFTGCASALALAALLLFVLFTAAICISGVPVVPLGCRGGLSPVRLSRAVGKM